MATLAFNELMFVSVDGLDEIKYSDNGDGSDPNHASTITLLSGKEKVVTFQIKKR